MKLIWVGCRENWGKESKWNFGFCSSSSVCVWEFYNSAGICLIWFDYVEVLSYVVELSFSILVILIGFLWNQMNPCSNSMCLMHHLMFNGYIDLDEELRVHFLCVYQV